MSTPQVWDALPPVAPPDQPLLVDAMAQAELDHAGFVIMPLLSDDDVEEVRRHHAALHPEPGHGFELDLATVSSSHKRRVDAVLEPVWQRALAPRLVEPQFFMSSFAVKWPGTASRLPVHQDWSCVDEDRHRSLVVWLALDDIGPAQDNGALAVLPGSHRFLAPPRGAMTIPWYWEYGEYIGRHLHQLHLRAGEIAVFDGRLLHASEANRSGSPRRAAVTRVARRDVPLVYVDHTDNGLDLYQVDHDFFIERGPLDLRSRPPDGHPVVGRRSNVVPTVDPNRLAALCGSDEVPLPSGEQLTRDQLLGAPDRSVVSTADGAPAANAGAAPSRTAPGGRRSRLLAALRQVFATRVRGGRGAHTTDHAPMWSIDGTAAASAIADVVGDTGTASPPPWGPSPWVAAAPPFLHHRCDLHLPTGVRAIDGALDAVDCAIASAFLASLPPSGRMRLASGTGGWSGLLVVRAPAVHGAAALRLGDRHVPLETGTTCVFETHHDHEVWNLGGTDCIVLGWRSTDPT